MVDKNSQSVTNVFMLLAVLAMAALAWSVSRQGGNEADRLLLPELTDNLNAVSAIQITAANKLVVAGIDRTADEAWVLVNAGGYPADVGKLRELLLGLAEAELVEQKTANPEYYDRLGVADVESPEATGLQVDIAYPGGNFAIIVGDSGINGDYTYVRKPAEAQSWLVSGNLTPGGELRDWLDRTIVAVGIDRISAVTIEHADGETISIDKADESQANFELQDMPAGRELSYVGALDTLAGVTTLLELDDVAPAAEIAAATRLSSAEFLTFDGLRLGIDVYDNDGVYALTVSATAEPEGPAEEAAEITARTQGWAYTVPSYKSDQLLSRREDLLK